MSFLHWLSNFSQSLRKNGVPTTVMNLQLCQLSAHFIGIWLLIVVSYDPLYFCVVCCNFSFFIFNFIDLSLLIFFFWMSLANGLSISFIFSKNQLLVFTDLCFSFLHFFFLYFCSNLYDFFPSTNCGFLFFFFYVL